MTLIEVMVVVFIIGLATGLVVLTLPPRPTPEQSTAQAFAAAMSQAQDKAIMTGQPIGLIVAGNRYSLAQYRSGRWQSAGVVRLKGGLKIDLLRDSDEASPEGWPDLIFDPTGVSEPAEFRLRGRLANYDINWTGDGEVAVDER